MYIVVSECNDERDDENEDYEDEYPPSPAVESFDNSRLFYKPSPSFKRGCFKEMFLRGFKCSQCGNYIRHCSLSGYCFIHKRVKDANESCPSNTRNNYKNINMP